MAIYAASSPWYETPIVNNYLDLLVIRPIPAESDDFIYSLEPQYTHRPDLLAYDMYGTNKLWWVFIQRNLDRIQDPIYDFIPGLEIFLPKKASLLRALGT